MSVSAGTVLATARTFLNDDAAVNWTNAALFPKLTEAHYELQIKLRRAAAPVMKGVYVEQLTPGATQFATQPIDLVAPIQLLETFKGGAPNTYQLMTEDQNVDRITPPGPAISNWAWIDEIIKFAVPSIIMPRQVLMRYWRALATPAVVGDLIGFINGELFLAPRTAAIAFGSVGQMEDMAAMNDLANGSITEVILSNRGRAPQVLGGSPKP